MDKEDQEKIAAIKRQVRERKAASRRGGLLYRFRATGAARRAC